MDNHATAWRFCPVYRTKGDISFIVCPEVCDSCLRQGWADRAATWIADDSQDDTHSIRPELQMP